MSSNTRAPRALGEMRWRVCPRLSVWRHADAPEQVLGPLRRTEGRILGRIFAWQTFGAVLGNRSGIRYCFSTSGSLFCGCGRIRLWQCPRLRRLSGGTSMRSAGSHGMACFDRAPNARIPASGRTTGSCADIGARGYGVRCVGAFHSCAIRIGLAVIIMLCSTGLLSRFDLLLDHLLPPVQEPLVVQSRRNHCGEIASIAAAACSCGCNVAPNVAVVATVATAGSCMLTGSMFIPGRARYGRR